MTLSPSLEVKVKGLSDDPGVYLMKDLAGVIIYVGKAKNLKNRVSSYFRESKDHSPKTQLLVKKIHDFEIVITDSEVEALLLEVNLIKKYKPKFNIRLKDDKSYPYVRLDTNHPFPRLEYVRKVKKDGARYFGPYVSSYHIRDLLRWSQKAFKLRDCSDNEFRNRSRPCILHQMNQCTAPCVGLISEEDYAKNIKTVLDLLDGKNDKVCSDLKNEMQMLSESERFEEAAEVRDRIIRIEEISERQKITDPESWLDRDAVHYARSSNNTKAVVVVMAIREGKTVGVFQFPFEDIESTVSDEDFIFEFLAQYYIARHQNSAQLLPKEVLFPLESENIKEQAALLSRALGKRVEFRNPKRGELAEYIAMVKKTAEHHLTELMESRTSSVEDLIDVQRKLDLKIFPTRIECFDISHFQGEGTVASRVVFIEGRPEKELYRNYHIEEVGGGFGEVDDFASMREVLSRRFSNDISKPDLVLIDGGKGQLAQAIKIFEELGVIGVELVSIAKARTDRGFEDAEVTSSMERIFKPNQKNPILLKPGTGAYRVLTQARDESHRFAINFHRQVRDKRVLGKK